MRMRHRLAVAAALVPAAFGCGGDDAPPGPPPPPVTATRPVKRTVRDYLQITGTVRAIEFAELRARVSGTLQEMRFEPSVFVEKDDVLFVIEPGPYQAAYDDAAAALTAAESQLAIAESDLAKLESAGERAVSQQDVDRAKAVRDQAQAAVNGAKARKKQARISLDYTEVKTPIAGQVSRNFVDVGNLVGVGEPTLLTTVTRIDPIYVYFDVPESKVLEAMERRTEEWNRDEYIPVLAAKGNDVGFPHEGQIDYIDNTVDPATGTIEVRAIFENEDRNLFPGLFVRARVLGPEAPATVLVEERAIGTDMSGKYVLVVGEGNVVERRGVTLGAVQEDGTVAVLDGLDGSELYIVEGLLKARPGLPVTPEVRGG